MESKKAAASGNLDISLPLRKEKKHERTKRMEGERLGAARINQLGSLNMFHGAAVNMHADHAGEM